MTLTGDTVYERAKAANSPDLWDSLWRAEGEESWRRTALSQVYTRICRLIPKGSSVVDLGGGVGLLAKRLVEEKACDVLVVDHSQEALNQAAAHSSVKKLDLENQFLDYVHKDKITVATEILEHLTDGARRRILGSLCESTTALLSVPNNRLGPEEEPQHTIKFTALSFLQLLRQFWGEACRVEVLGPYLLGVCGRAARKTYKLSVTLPIRDEALDLEATLASFREVADEIVVGIDPRSTDNSRQIAEEYAEVVFDLVDPSGPEEERVEGENKVHFAWIRNQCMAKCTGDWIFMTEGHERLATGQETLLNLHKLPQGTKVCYVLRSGGGQQWIFPWLTKNEPGIKYKRAVHNIPTWPEGSREVTLPEVRTLHDRARDREKVRGEQRKAQNRLHLMEDWIVNHNEASLFYLGSEWREWGQERAIQYLEELLTLPQKNGAMRYQARLILSKTLWKRGEQADLKRVREVLLGCTGEDWSRVEHWLWLGDLSRVNGNDEEALQFYKYSASRIGEPPLSPFWIDLSVYSYLPAQRLAEIFSALGRLSEALVWARIVRDNLPDNAPSAAFDEVSYNIRELENAVRELENEQGAYN